MNPVKVPEFIFLLSSERSGTNLVTRLFDSHSAVCGPAASYIGSEIIGNLHRYGDLRGADETAFLDDFMDLFESKIGEWKVPVERDEIRECLRSGSPLDAYLKIYRLEAEAHGKKTAFIKENAIPRWAAVLIPVLERTRFLYLHRDPRDMALSWKHAPALRGGVVRAAQIWSREQDEFMRLRAGLQATTGMHVPRLSYEALVANPEASLRKVCTSLGLQFEPGMLAFHEKRLTQSQAEAVTELHNLARPVIRTNAGKHRGRLSNDELRYCESTCATAMRALGYELETEPLSDSKRAELQQVLEPLEPWEKPAYSRLPEPERRRREGQHRIITRIRSRPIRLASAL